MHRGGVDAEEGIELFVGAFEFTGEAEEFYKDAAGRYIGRAISDMFGSEVDCAAQVTGLKNFLDVAHGISCSRC